MILIITNSIDPHADAVLKLLKEKKISHYRLNTENFPTKIKITWEAVSGSQEGIIYENGKKVLSLSEITAVWYRRPEKAHIHKKLSSKAVTDFVTEESLKFLNGLYKYLGDRFWINYPFQVRQADHKMANLTLAAKIGFNIPRTIMTNDPVLAKQFVKECKGRVAAKVIGQPIINHEDNEFVIYTNLLKKDDIKRLSSVKYAPTQLQEYVEKKIELRVTIVGKKIFACEIHSQDSEKTKVDWRHYDFKNVKHVNHKLPNDITEKLLAMQTKLGLRYGAYDFIVTPQGKYVFLELNPNGQYLWIERITKMPISEAIVDLLIKGSEEHKKLTT